MVIKEGFAHKKGIGVKLFVFNVVIILWIKMVDMTTIIVKNR